jgi:hypothetical protein
VSTCYTLKEKACYDHTHPQRADANEPHKIAAVLAQLGSFATTYGCLLALGRHGYSGFFVALGIEFFLAAGKSLVFDGKKSGADAFGWIAIIVDTLLNAGGIWPGVQTLDKAPTWIMLKQSMGLNGELGHCRR